MASNSTMGKLPGLWIVLCHQVCLTGDGKKPSTIFLTPSFLFTVRRDKWLDSIPPENNITLAFTVCPCLVYLPLPVFLPSSIFSFFFLFFFTCRLRQTLHTSTLNTHSSHPFPTILTLSLFSVWNTLFSLIPLLSLSLHHLPSRSSPTE